jgi:hypothetical protein
MLHSIYDVELAKVYMEESFPQLEGRLAVRSFDPPSISNGSDNFDRFLDQQAARVWEDIVGQTPSHLRRSLKEAWDLTITLNGRIPFFKALLSPDPQLIILKKNEKPGFFYVLGMPDESKTESPVYTQRNTLNPNDRKIFDTFMLMHEFCHIVQGPSSSRNERICDAFGLIATMSLRDLMRLSYIEPVMATLHKARLMEGAANPYAIHNTSVVVKRVIDDMHRLPPFVSSTEALDFARQFAG